MSEIKMPEAIHHSRQFHQADLGETIYLRAGERPSGEVVELMLGAIYNADDLPCIEEVEDVEIAAIAFADKVVRAFNEYGRPVDLLLYCPNCGAQHIDEAKPDVCETCGNPGPECACSTFTAWLNPPHKSHRCNSCNHVWRPADVPTNGVAAIQSKGQRDGDPKPAAVGDLIMELTMALENLGNWLAYGIERPDGPEVTGEEERRCQYVAEKAGEATAKGHRFLGLTSQCTFSGRVAPAFSQSKAKGETRC